MHVVKLMPSRFTSMPWLALERVKGIRNVKWAGPDSLDSGTFGRSLEEGEFY